MANLSWKLDALRTTIFSQKKCEEHVDPELIEGFIQDKMGIAYEGIDRYKVLPFRDELLQINKYKTKYNKVTKTYIASHALPKHKWGRVVPSNYLSLSIFHRPTRHALCDDNYIDLDLVNCHPTILYQFSKNKNLKKPFLEKYVNNPKGIRLEVAEHHKVSKDTAKQLMIRLMFGGSYDSWIKDNNLDENKLPFINGLSDEMSDLIELVYSNNPQIEKDVLKHDPKKWTTINEKKRGVMAFWCQSLERQIQEHCIQSLGIRIEDVVPCQDGFMILKKHFSPDIVDKLNKAVLDQFHLELEWVVKPFDEKINIRRVKSIKDQREIDKEAKEELKNRLQKENDELLAEQTLLFEETHCKIENTGTYVKKDGNKNIIYSESQLRSCYKHIQCGYTNSGVPICFIDRWICCNNDIRTYKDIGMYPSNCPDNIYNLWTPFTMELKNYYEEIPEAIDIFKQHVSILCNHEKEMVDYVIHWIAHAIQYPEEKSTMITFISSQGAGKNTLMKFLKQMLGKEKYFETTDPSRDVWGSFNGAIAEKYIVMLNELSALDLKNAEGKIKGLITDDTMTINQKGVPQYEVQSYHKFICSTNNKEAIKPSKDDRRNCLIECSDELCNEGKTEEEQERNFQYMTTIEKHIKNEDSIKTIYEWLKSIEGLQGFGFKRAPKTAFHMEQTQLSMDPIEVWIRSWIVERNQGDVIVKQTGELFKIFSSWVTDNFSDYKITSLQFGVRLSRLKIKGMSKLEDKFRSRQINVDDVLKHYNITP